MFRIRRIYDEILPINQTTLEQVKAILRTRFASVPENEIQDIGRHLRDPFLKRYRMTLFVAENARQRVLGFAVLLHEPRIEFCYLDWIATLPGKASGGIGGALYDRVRHEASALGFKGLFFECLPDEPSLCPQTELLAENRARLQFYERYGARPIVGTAYEEPYKAGQTCLPHLMFDGLGRLDPPGKSLVRRVIRAILERKYAGHVPSYYVDAVVDSVQDDPVRLRAFRYVKPARVDPTVRKDPGEPIALVVSDRHAIHHIHEMGYVESPVRIRSIVNELAQTGLFKNVPPAEFPEKHILSVHHADFVNYIRRASAETPEGNTVYPYVFPIRNQTRPPKERSVLSGYYCIDTFTPITANAHSAARRAVDCALTAAREITQGCRTAYALVRPPGHHAERRSFGGFCYFNNSAIAAQYLRSFGKVAILDVDYHHGNGQQEIFYDRPDVLTISIHGHPSFAYPYFSGFREEIGEGEGAGFNLNLALPEVVDGPKYRRSLEKAFRRLEEFDPDFLVVALGLDTAKGDPTGTWRLTAKDFEQNGRMIGELGLPTLVVQEGGYRTRSLGVNARNFFQGLAAGRETHPRRRPGRSHPAHGNGIHLRRIVRPEDRRRVRHMVMATGFFNAAEVAVAEELVAERLAKGAASGYSFVFAEVDGRTLGYACFGPVPMTAASYDLYWIVVTPDAQRKGVGRVLLAETERIIRQAGGERIYVDTSARPQYDSTRAFYVGMGFRQEALFEDFYAPGDGKAIYVKSL